MPRLEPTTRPAISHSRTSPVVALKSTTSELPLPSKSPWWARGTSVSVSVALLLPGTGSEAPAGTATAAVLLMLPTADGETVTISRKSTLEPTGRLTVWLMLPDPEAVQVAPPLGLQVQVAPSRVGGSVSVTTAPVMGSGPLLATVIR
jgi:hypothetical protein